MKKQAITASERAVNDQRIWDRHSAAAVGNFLNAAAMGVGGMGLFHLLKKTKKKLVDENLPKAPDYNAIATAGFLPEDFAAERPVEKLSSTWDSAGPVSTLDKALFYGLPVAGAGLGAYLNAKRSKKDKFRAALSGAAMGGGVGLAGGLGLTNFGRLVSQSPFKEVPETNNNYHEGLSYAARIGAMPAGLIAGGALANTLLDSHDTKEKEKKNINTIQDARNEYFKTLVADEKAAAALDAAFTGYKKGAASWWDYIPDTEAWTGGRHGGSAGGPNNGLQQNEGAGNTAANVIITLPIALTALASLGAAGVGGTYMYNKTQENSAAKQLARARKARERLNTLPGSWIDPREVANVKALASGNQTASGV